MERAPFASIPGHRSGKAARAGAAAMYVTLSATALAALAWFESVPVRAEPRGETEVTDGLPQAKQSATTTPAPIPAKAKTAGAGAAATAPEKTAHLASTSAAAAAAPETPSTAQPALTVPSFRGKRL